jgi:starvation-inducible DNA-binding protein
MTKIEAMNQFVANLAVWSVKLHNIHWNVQGLQFMPVHKFTEELYDGAFEAYDDVAERIKILGETPLSTMKDYLDGATIAEIAPKGFGIKESLGIVKADLELLKAQARAVRDLADKDGDVGTVSMFEDLEGDYAKNIWFLNAMLGA